MKKFVLAIAFLCAAAPCAFSQETRVPDISTIVTDKGMMVMSRNKVQPFAILIAGTSAFSKQNDDGSLLIRTDEAGIFIYFVKTTDFLTPDQETPASTILNAHRDWDIANQQKGWKGEMMIDTKGSDVLSFFDHRGKTEIPTSAPTVYWSYPAPNSQNTRSLYQTVLIGDTVLMIGTVFDASTKFEEVRSFFKKTLESITLLPPQTPETVKPVKSKKTTTVKKKPRN